MLVHIEINAECVFIANKAMHYGDTVIQLKMQTSQSVSKLENE